MIAKSNASTRPSWDEYFMRIAHDVATRATCDRKHVGAVIVDSSWRIVSTGYNGAPRGLPHCDEVGHELADIDGRQSCIRTLHAESNAIDYAGPNANGGRIYTTVIPCFDCAKRIVNAGIERVVYDEYYQSRKTNLVNRVFLQADVKLVCLGGVQTSCSHCGCVWTIKNDDPDPVRCPDCARVWKGTRP